MRFKTISQPADLVLGDPPIEVQVVSPVATMMQSDAPSSVAVENEANGWTITTRRPGRSSDFRPTEMSKVLPRNAHASESMAPEPPYLGDKLKWPKCPAPT